MSASAYVAELISTVLCCGSLQDPYFMKNHLGTYECKLCLTLHTTEVWAGMHSACTYHGFLMYVCVSMKAFSVYATCWQEMFTHSWVYVHMFYQHTCTHTHTHTHTSHTRTHTHTHVHTHTHLYLYLYYHCQNWLRTWPPSKGWASRRKQDRWHTLTHALHKSALVTHRHSHRWLMSGGQTSSLRSCTFHSRCVKYYYLEDT